MGGIGPLPDPVPVGPDPPAEPSASHFWMVTLPFFTRMSNLYPSSSTPLAFPEHFLSHDILDFLQTFVLTSYAHLQFLDPTFIVAFDIALSSNSADLPRVGPVTIAIRKSGTH